MIGAHLSHGDGISFGTGDGSAQESLKLRGSDHKDGLGSFQAVKQGFEQLTHGLQFVGIEQRTHALPQLALAAKLGPHGLKQGTTKLLRLIHQNATSSA